MQLFQKLKYLYMKNKINIKKTIERMKEQYLQVLPIDKENMTYTYSDGNEYPLMDGMDYLTVEELQKQLDNARQTTYNILKQIEEENG